MPDDETQPGKPDRDRVSSKEKYEVDHLAKKVGLPAPLVKKVIEQEGPSRRKVEDYLKRMKRNGEK